MELPGGAAGAFRYGWPRRSRQLPSGGGQRLGRRRLIPLVPGRNSKGCPLRGVRPRRWRCGCRARMALSGRAAGVLRAASRPASRLVHRSAGAPRTPRRPRPARTRRRGASRPTPGNRPRRRRRRPRRRWCRSGLAGSVGLCIRLKVRCVPAVLTPAGHTMTR